MPGRRAPEAERREQILEAAFRVAIKSRLEGLTMRAVAEKAKLSPGLVFFHFESREALLVALLDWLLAGTVIGTPGPEVWVLPTAAERLLALLRQELVLLPGRRARIELFFDYWVAGMANPKIRKRIRAALAGYREVMLPLAEAVIQESPAAWRGVNGSDLAALVVAVIEGCVVQAVMDPAGFDVERVMATLASVVEEKMRSPQ
jgi:TetR/AcrR family transcriptional regulator, transcriptional repressor of bet genes